MSIHPTSITPDYVKIISSNWEYFQGDFGDQKVFEGHIRNVTELRNAFKHGREVANHDLAVGEGGLMWLEECLKVLIDELEDEVDDDENSDEK